MKLRQLVSVLMISLLSSAATAEKVPSLEEILDAALAGNPGLASEESLFQAEQSLITAEYTLEDPMLGISTLNRGMETKYAVISQRIRFPMKYYLMGKAQYQRAEAQKSLVKSSRLQLRQQITTLYYAIYSIQKITDLAKANIQAVKEFARVAERRYAAGTATQADSMKAHFEITQLELDLIRLHQENDSLQAELKALIGQDKKDFADLHFNQVVLEVPRINWAKLNPITEKEIPISLQTTSPGLKVQASLLAMKEHRLSLAQWSYAPDFQLQYQQQISGEPEDSEIFSISLTFPFYFWKKNAEASSASSKKIAQEYRLANETELLMAKVKSLKSKVEAGAKTLEIYNTSLIPQASGAYNSSRAAYRASKATFLDLLDSERSLYSVKAGFFRSLRQHVKNLTELEAELGFSASNLAKGSNNDL